MMVYGERDSSESEDSNEVLFLSFWGEGGGGSSLWQ